MRLNLQSKLILPTLIAVILGMSMAAWVSYRASRDALREALHNQMAQAADMGVRQVHGWINDLNKDLHGMAENPVFSRALSSESETDARAQGAALLGTAKKDYGFYDVLGLADRNGLTVVSSDPALDGVLNVSDRDYFREAIAGKAALSKVVRSKVSNRPIFVIAAPVHQGSEISGVLFAAVDLGKFTEAFISPIRIGKKGYAFAVDGEGAFIAHPDSSLVLDINIKKFTWGEPFLGQATGLLQYEFKGENKILYHKREELTGWSIAICATEQDIFAPIVHIRTLNLVAAIVTVLATGAIIFLMVRSVVRALCKGIEFAQAVKGGDVSHRLNLVRDDELGLLGSALDSMADSLAEKAQLAARITSGDLQVEVRLASEADVLGRALSEMVANLNDILGQVQSSGEQIATGAAQVSDGSQSLSQGATESAASIEQIGSSLAEMASQTKTNAENAAQANHLTGAAREAAECGNEQMNEMVQAMADINAASQNISRIIKVIDEIAFQTNLLALNAAVEAARAGQHGKGFAIVAEEVRNLAARSAKAARETAQLIEGSVQKAESGTQIADRTAGALGEIVREVTKVSDLVAEIAAASNEQAQGLAQVNIGLGQIDQVTQQNTANAEESAAAAEELAGQADGLRHLLSRFRLSSRPAAVAEISVPHAPTQQPSRPEVQQGWGGTKRPVHIITLNGGGEKY